MRYNCSVDKINHFKSLMKLYNGLDNCDSFKWIYNQVKERVSLQYYLRNQIHTNSRGIIWAEASQLLNQLQLSLNNQFLGHLFLFRVSSSFVTIILSSWLPHLSLDLKPLLFRPTQEQAQNYYLDCFKKINIRMPLP